MSLEAILVLSLYKKDEGTVMQIYWENFGVYIYIYRFTKKYKIYFFVYFFHKGSKHVLVSNGRDVSVRLETMKQKDN